jgi:hypothetical protein
MNLQVDNWNSTESFAFGKRGRRLGHNLGEDMHCNQLAEKDRTDQTHVIQLLQCIALKEFLSLGGHFEQRRETVNQLDSFSWLPSPLSFHWLCPSG